MDALDEALDTIFSIFTRVRFADFKGYVHCYTCPWYGHWKECDAGHFISRGNGALRWEKNNARPQCTECNRIFHGRPDTFEQELREEIGEGAVDELQVRAIRERYPDTEDRQALLIHYKMLVKGLGIKV